MSLHAASGVDAYLDPRLPSFGYCIDVGANIDSGLSNSLHFEEKGWVVLCIEPNPRLIEDGRKYRKLWRPIACGDRNTDEARFTSLGGYPYAAGSGFSLEEYFQYYPGDRSADQERFLVPMRTLDRVLEESGFPRLDFLTIDTEGFELEVLKGITLDKWHPAWISCESWDSGDEITRYLSGHGYLFDCRMGVDNLYRRT